MLKHDKLVKYPEARLLDAVRDLIGNVPTVQVDSVDHAPEASQDYGVDGIVGLSCAGGSYALVVAVKSNGAPRFVRSGVYQLESCVAKLRQSHASNPSRRLIPMLVSPYLSPASRGICSSHDVAYLDFAGNARLAFDSVYVERTVAEKPRSEARALRSVFAPRAAAILRALLRDPERSWRVADLSAEANASYGHVSNVRRALLEREWLEIRDDGAVLTQPDALLRTWRENYRRPVGQSVTGYTRFHGRQLDNRLQGKLNQSPEGPRAIHSLLSAAQWLAPFGRSGTHTFYVDHRGADMLKEELKLTHAARGANVVLHVPTDESLFDDASEPAPAVFCSSPIVTYLDLWNGNEREREAGEHLASELFPWLR